MTTHTVVLLNYPPTVLGYPAGAYLEESKKATVVRLRLPRPR